MRNHLLNKLKKAQFDTKYARTKGVSSKMLGYYVQRGLLVRLAHGVYAFPKKLTFDFEGLLKEKIVQAPQAVIGLTSALKLFALTEEAPRVIDLFVPETNVPKKKMEDVRFHTVKEHLLKEGITKVKGLPVTTIERTIVDFLRKKGTISQGIDILHEAHKRGIKIKLSEILRLGVLFRIGWKADGVVGKI